MGRATLLVIQGQDQGARYEIGETPLGIGRGVRNEVRLLDTEVSRQHAQVARIDGGRYVVVDRGSSNGTFLNGRPVKSASLADGDRVTIGRSVMLFAQVVGDESRYAESVIDLVGRPETHDPARIVGRVGDGRPGEGPSSTLPFRPGDANVLYRITEEAVSPSSSVEQMLGRVLDLTIAAVAADRGCVLLRDDETGELMPVAVRHRKPPGTAQPGGPGKPGGPGGVGKMPVSLSIADYVLRTGQGVRTSDARHDARFDTGQSILQAGIREALCVPMQGRYESIGVLYVDTTSAAAPAALDAETFADEHLRLLVAAGRQAALAVENNRYQQALVKAERMAAMGHTIALLSHHIKNILQGVRGGSYLIDMGLSGHNEELIRKGWQIVEKNQGKIYHLVMDMLTFSKERKPALKAGSVNETIGDVCELMQARAEECGVTLACALDDSLPEATFDPEGLHRAVLNVVTNAIDAVEGSADGAVRIETGRLAEGDAVFVAVTDNGPGIPPEKLRSIFNVFESSKGARGTGLGLAVSRKILREHGGEIAVESEPGQGSRFVLSWPRHLDEDHRPPDRKTAEHDVID